MKMPYTFLFCTSLVLTTFVQSQYQLSRLKYLPSVVKPSFYTTFSQATSPHFNLSVYPFPYQTHHVGERLKEMQQKARKKLERYIIRDAIFEGIGGVSFFNRITSLVPKFNTLLRSIKAEPMDAGKYWLGLASQGLVTLSKKMWRDWWLYQQLKKEFEQ